MKSIRTIILAAALLLGGLAAQAQVSTSGKVVDKDDNSALPGVYVMALKDGKMLGYGFSETDGSFTLKTKTAPDALKATVLGYEVTSVSLTAGQTPVIAMSKKKMDIKSSVVTSHAIEEKGDTISYDAGAFREKEDLVLADILKKLPDITVSSTGTILHKGEAISKFYVEGMDLMGARYGVVTNNLSAKDIAKVEVYQRHQPVRALKGIVTPERSAINIVLKESAKGSWIFGADAAVGASAKEPLFEARLLVTRFAKKNQDLFMLKGNDDGTDIVKELQTQPYWGKPGVYLIPQSGLDNDFNSLISPRSPSLGIPKSYWYDNMTGTASLNHLSKLSETSQINVSAQGAVDRQLFSSGNTEEVYFTDGTGMTIVEDDSDRDLMGWLSVDLNYENNANEKYISDKVSFSGQSRTSGSTITGTSPYSEKYRLPSFKVNNDLDMTFRRSDTKAFSLKNTTSFIRNSHSAKYTTASDDTAAGGDSPDVDEGTSDPLTASVIGQDVSTYSFNNSTSSTFSFKAGSAKISLGAQLDIDWLREETRTSNLDWLSEVESSDLGSPTYELPFAGGDMSKLSFEGDLDVFSLTPRVNLSTNLYAGPVEFIPAVSASIAWMHESGGVSHWVPDVEPSLDIKIPFARDFEFRVHGRYELSNSGAESLLDAVVLRNYRSLTVQDNLKRTQDVNVNAGIKYSNNIDMIYAGISGHYTYINASKVRASYYTNNYTVSGWLDRYGDRMSYGVSANISKYFGVKTLVVTLRGSYNVADNKIAVQNNLIESRDRTAQGTFEIRSSALQWLTVGADVNYAFARNSRSNEFDTHNVILNGNLTVRPVKAVSIIGNVYYSWYKIVGTDMNNMPLCDVGVDWRLKKFTIFAKCNNFLNSKELRRASTTSFQTLTYYSKLRGCEGIVGVRVSL
ncbi:MAG: carboxypeptidase-like regulatory domain-containing protein [Bacteroidales bacterium]|nr:carboxypeptidase-like regulatory domain-containing protein [Bacteroidales bacterium]